MIIKTIDLSKVGEIFKSSQMLCLIFLLQEETVKSKQNN